MNNILEIENVSKSYEQFTLEDISIQLPKGYIMGLIGPNGSGKTTLIKIILNMINKSNGKISILGKDHIADELDIKPSIGVVMDVNYFVEDWKVSQVEKSISRFYKTWNSEKYNQLLKTFKIDTSKNIKSLSRGMQMKLMLACAFSYDAKLLILDEPTSGLDPISRDELLDILSTYIEDGEHSVLFSTHITSDLDKIADYITFINYGQLIFTGTKDDFLDNYRIIRGSIESLNSVDNAKLIGIRKYSSGFEALVESKHLKNYEHLDVETPTSENIMIFIGKETA